MKILKRIALSLAVAAMVLVFMPTTAEAETRMEFSPQIGVIKGSTASEIVWGMPANGKITKLKSSNKEVVSVKSEDSTILITGKKAGTAQITFTVKYGKKKKNFSAKVTVADYQTPVKSFKVDGKEVKTKFKKKLSDGTYVVSYSTKLKTKKKVKIDVKVRSGWIITNYGFTYYYGDGLAAGHLPVYDNPSRLKRTITADSKLYSAYVAFLNKKTGVREQLNIYFK